jgi:hypothetical protein
MNTFAANARSAELEKHTFLPLIAPQPDANGGFATPAEGAKFMASFGIQQIPLRDKAPSYMDGWQNKGSVDFNQIDQWAADFPGCNFGSIAKAVIGAHFVLEVDSADVRLRFKKATGHDNFTLTLTVKSRELRGHRWYLQTLESIALGNLSQGSVVGGDFSLRVNNEQCVSPGSRHPETGTQYTVAVNMQPVAATIEEIDWLRSQKIAPNKSSKESDDGIEIILQGHRNSRLAHIAGKLRDAGLTRQQIETNLLEINSSRVQPPLPLDEVKTIARSISSYDAGRDTRPLIDGVPAGTAKIVPPVVLELSAPEVRPVFPRWVMQDTSVYEGLVKPACEQSTKYPEMIFMPAVLYFLNTLGGRVRIKDKNVILTIYLGLVSKAGRFFKSSCCELAQDYFSWVGLVGHPM